MSLPCTQIVFFYFIVFFRSIQGKQFHAHTKSAAARSCAFLVCKDTAYSAGRMNERELNTFFVTFTSAVGSATSTPITFRPSFDTRTET